MTLNETNIDRQDMVLASTICKSIFDGTHESPKRRGSGFKLVTSRHIKGNKVLTEDAYFINEEDYREINKRSRLQIGDVLFTMIGTVGEVCRITEEPDFAIKNIGVFRPAELSDSVWIYYYLLSPEGRKNIEEAKRGTTQQFIGLKELREFPIHFPHDSFYRRKQLKILELIDEKIESNNSLSKTLEDIAQTIFKSWFIDFDPVKAKMAGEKPEGMDDATVALFPDSLVESALGMIPKDWEVSDLDSISSVKYGAPFASKLFNTTKMGQPLIRIRDLKKQSISTWSPEKHPKGFLVTGGELLIGMDGEFNPTIWFGEDALVNQRICKIEPKEFVSNFFLYFTLVPIMRKIEHGSTGSTVIHLGKTDIDAIKVPIPSREILTAFKSLVEPLLKQIVALNIQVRILQEVRDALLPRLISGELQIPEEMLAS